MLNLNSSWYRNKRFAGSRFLYVPFQIYVNVCICTCLNQILQSLLSPITSHPAISHSKPITSALLLPLYIKKLSSQHARLSIVPSRRVRDEKTRRGLGCHDSVGDLWYCSNIKVGHSCSSHLGITSNWNLMYKHTHDGLSGYPTALHGCSKGQLDSK